MHPILLKIGPVTIYTYGFFVFTGIILAYYVCLYQAGKVGICRDTFANMLFWVLVWGFIGARLVYLVVEWRDFIDYPLALIFSRSGFVFFGGLISGVISLYILSYRKRLDFLKVADIFSLGLPLAHSFGRLGCFFYGCCYGKPTNSFLGILFPPGSPAGLSGVKVIPTQIISAAILLVIFLFLWIYSRKERANGYVLTAYLFIYGVFRFFIEFFRGDPRGQVFGLSTSQIFSLAVLILSIFLFRTLHTKKKDR